MRPFSLYILAAILLLSAPQGIHSMPYLYQQLGIRLADSYSGCENGRCNEQLKKIAARLFDTSLLREEVDSVNRTERLKQDGLKMSSPLKTDVILETGRTIRRHAREVKAKCSPDCD